MRLPAFERTDFRGLDAGHYASFLLRINKKM